MDIKAKEFLLFYKIITDFRNKGYVNSQVIDTYYKIGKLILHFYMQIENRIIKSGKVHWESLTILQPDGFKELSEAAHQKLKRSMITNNFIQSFKVWEQTDDHPFAEKKEIYCLDGFHRIKILKELKQENYKIPETFPADFINCEDKKEAAKFVLIYSSIYAKINNDSYLEFLNLNELDFDALKIELDIPEIDFGELNKINDLFSVDLEEKKEEPRNKVSDDGYSNFELVMQHENKLKLVKIINAVKEKHALEKTEDALMEIANFYKIKNELK